MESDPVAVALKFGFLAVLYLFLFWVGRSALRELRGTTQPAPEPTGYHSLPGESRGGIPDAWLVAIGRSADADVRIEDRFASGIHARIYPRAGSYYVEDMKSTNGTFLNGDRLDGEVELAHLDVVEIGDTEFRFELAE